MNKKQFVFLHIWRMRGTKPLGGNQEPYLGCIPRLPAAEGGGGGGAEMMEKQEAEALAVVHIRPLQASEEERQAAVRALAAVFRQYARAEG